MFVIQLLGSMKISVELLVTVRVDDVGAIFMASNITTMSYTKHVDIRYNTVGGQSLTDCETILANCL